MSESGEEVSISSRVATRRLRRLTAAEQAAVLGGERGPETEVLNRPLPGVVAGPDRMLNPAVDTAADARHGVQTCLGFSSHRRERSR